MELQKKLLLNGIVWGNGFFVAISGGPQGQRYLHNNVKPVFAFFPMLMFAVVGKSVGALA